MSSNAASAPATVARMDGRGLGAAASAFLIWGLLPIYLKQLQSVSAFQITAHRLVWGCLLALCWLMLRRELSHVWTALRDPRIRIRLFLSAALISVNWLTYTWAIVTDRIVEASLGYFINPLVNVLLGVVVLSERLNPAQWTSVALAASAVTYLTWSTGQPPWISLTLAISFGLYGLVRKVVRVDALAGFTGETLMLLPVGLGYIVWCEIAGIGTVLQAGVGTNVLLALGGPLTAIPLVLFAFGARRIPLSTVGLLQYMAPSMQLLLGIFIYHEPFQLSRIVGFTLIWTALAIYAADGLWPSRKAAALAK